MKKLLFALTAVLALAACQKTKELVIADHGPSQTVTYDQSALMGSTVNFSVSLKDDIALSTLRVSLLFDETVVADTTIRTKTAGTYEGFLKVPFEKNIPDGTATLRVVSQNIQFGTTTEELGVAVSRPDFDHLTLIAGGKEYKMSKTSRNNYATEEVLNGAVDAIIVTDAIDAAGRKITFGFSPAQGITPEATGTIPFSGMKANYSATFNTLTWEGSPFVEITINGTKANIGANNTFVAVLNIAKGDAITLTGAPFELTDMELDPDFFTEDAKFAAVSGLYKFTLMLDSKYFYVERMTSATSYADINSGAIWMIGEAKHYGKPVATSAGWNTEVGPLCFAEVEPGIFQLTQEGGRQMASLSSLNVKIFHQHGWGGEFGGVESGKYYGSVESDIIVAGESDGNIHLAEGKSLEMGGIYRFTVDLTGGISAAVLKFEKIGNKEIQADNITVNGTKAELAGADTYVATLDLTKGAAMTFAGTDGIGSFWKDPDFFTADGKFGAVDGRYKVTVDKAAKVILARRVNADGTAPNLEQGGLYIQGWGVAFYVMGGGQVGWPGTGGYQMAQVAPGVYQMTGIAVAETDTTVGGRFRTDYISAKYFFQDGWGSEASKGVTIIGNAAGNLSQGSDGNFGLASDLEDGATYRLTVDFSGVTVTGNNIEGKETVAFEKL